MTTEPHRLLAIFAHPDDESFRPGGTMALLARLGVQVQVLTATRGQAGSRGQPPICSTDELPMVREDELHCACRALSLQEPILLDYLDGSLAETDPMLIVLDILRIIHEYNPQVLLTFGEDGISGHPDHVAIARYTRQAYLQADQVAALYTIAVPQSLASALGMHQIHAVPDDSIMLCVDVSAVWDDKMSAIYCHRTQLGESPILEAPIDRQRLFLGKEYFCRALARQRTDFFLNNLMKLKEN